MYDILTQCATPDCTNESYHEYCLSCSAQQASRQALEAAEGTCTHDHSITGDYEMIRRLLPEYKGSEPQPGYMLDVCKTCLQELQERPYNPPRKGILIRSRAADMTETAIPGSPGAGA